MNELEIQAVAMLKSVSLRFLKGAIAGATASVSAITIQAPHTWADLSTALVGLAYAGIVGFVAGGVLAVEKWYNWTP